VADERIRFVAEATKPGANMAKLCRQFEISRPTGYRWLNRFRECGSVAQLYEKTRRPNRSPRKSGEELEQKVAELRGRHGWGARKLKILLGEEGWETTVITVNRILKRRGLVAAEDSHRPAPKRFEREQPNDLWQMDTKGYYRMADRTVCHPLSIIDDHSRFLVGLYALPNLEGDGVWSCMVRTMREHGVPEQMLMDHGVPWWSNTNGHGLTQFAVRLMEQGIRLLYGRPYHPQTHGKVERVHRTVNERVQQLGHPGSWTGWGPLLARIRQEYNEMRPHEALQMDRPKQHYRPSARPFQQVPRRWEYPENSEVRKLNSQGCIELNGRRYFVCEALAGREVRVQRLDDHILISFCHMYIRELLPQGGNRPVICPATDNGGVA
jgi:transposase